MRSQELFQNMQSAKDIQVAIEADGDRIGDLLNERRPLPSGEGEPAFDYRKHLQNLKDQLSSAIDEAADIEDRHNQNLIRTSRLKGERDESVKQNHKRLVDVRDGLEGLYEGGGFELAHVSGKTPRVPGKLVEQMSQTAKLLRAPAVAPRQLKVDGFGVDLETVAADLESRIPGLRSTIDRLANARKKAEGTKVAKDAAIKALRRMIVWVGRTTEGLFFLAEEDELAKRIRKTTRRPQRPSEETAEQASAEESGSSNESTSELQAPVTTSES